MIGIYVHVPFCKTKCHYCDFASFAGGEALFEPYKNALLQEIAKAEYLRGQRISSIFIGGGTPTVLPAAFLAEIMGELCEFPLAANIEITVEANPNTLSPATLKNMKEIGINRVSIGLQAWQDHLLALLGRVHTQETFLRGYDAALSAGFDNINIDLMFALPEQTPEDWHETLENVAALKPAHIAAYGLSAEKGTPLAKQLHSGAIALPDGDTSAAFYHMAKDTLKRRGYAHYEISNFARASYASRHNTHYWRRRPYVGFGLSAHSFYNGARFANTGDLDRYINAKGDSRLLRENYAVVTAKQAMEEFIFLGLRMTKGVTAAHFFDTFGIEITDVFAAPLAKHSALGLLTVQNGRIALTARGIDVSNAVLADFLL